MLDVALIGRGVNGVKGAAMVVVVVLCAGRDDRRGEGVGVGLPYLY